MRRNLQAFTRIELAAVIATLALLGVIALPLLGATRSDSERLVCFNNLRLIGRAVQMWAGDHSQQFPWRTPIANGGEFTGTSRRTTAWVEYAFVSNEIVTPKILACPSDAGARRAIEWGQFTSFQYRGNAVSYALNMDGSMDVPQSWLSADRNFRAQLGAGACSTLVDNFSTIPTHVPLSTPLAECTNGVAHGTTGHDLSFVSEMRASARRPYNR